MKEEISLIGFPSDIGVRRNNGRAGASGGPAAFREAMKKYFHTFQDEGDIEIRGDDLESAQKELGDQVAKIMNEGRFPLTVGGGHEIAWGHFQGILQTPLYQDCAIINFDAHFDLRPLLEEGKGNSGTPFTQIREALFKKKCLFHYTILGIQQEGNSPLLHQRAKEFQAKILYADEFYKKGGSAALPLLDELISSHRSLFVTLCLDLFAEAFAPGVSAPQPLGLLPWHVVPSLEKLASSGKVIGFNIAELAPPLDHEGKTARLAASLTAHFLRKLTVLF